MFAGDSAGDEVARRQRRAQELRERADRLDASAGKYEKGRQGELAVAAELERLRHHGYGYVADIRWPGTTKANVDFLAFGPAGAFVIDAKNWSGAVTVTKGVLRQNRYRRDRETDKVNRMARDLDSLLSAPAGTCRPLICLVAQPSIPVTQCGSTYVTGIGSLVAWLSMTPVYWDPERVMAISKWLPGVLTPASSGGRVSVLGPTNALVAAQTVASTTHSQTQAVGRGRHRREDKGLYGHLR